MLKVAMMGFKLGLFKLWVSEGSSYQRKALDEAFEGVQGLTP